MVATVPTTIVMMNERVCVIITYAFDTEVLSREFPHPTDGKATTRNIVLTDVVGRKYLLVDVIVNPVNCARYIVVTPFDLDGDGF